MGKTFRNAVKWIVFPPSTILNWICKVECSAFFNKCKSSCGIYINKDSIFSPTVPFLFKLPYLFIFISYMYFVSHMNNFFFGTIHRIHKHKF